MRVLSQQCLKEPDYAVHHLKADYYSFVPQLLLGYFYVFRPDQNVRRCALTFLLASCTHSTLY